MPKDCLHCMYLEYIEAEEWDPKGYACMKRQYRNWDEEYAHQRQLESLKYLSTPKRCHESEPTTNKRG